MTLPSILSLAWWAAKWAIARKRGADLSERAKPLLSPWVMVPALAVAALIVLQASISSAYNRGDAAGYQRRDGELAAETAKLNTLIAETNAVTATLVTQHAGERQRLLNEARAALAAKAAADALARKNGTEAQQLSKTLETVKASKTKWKIRNVFKTKTVVRRVEGGGGNCAVGPEITAKLNAIN